MPSASSALIQTVLSAQQQAAVLISQVNFLVTTGHLNGGNGNALTSKLDGAIGSLDNGNTTAGINKLNAFINQVIALKKAGKLTELQSQLLIDGANDVIASIV